jgi:stage II sporulation protein GA (sporulation sigma-E factor processing peptidase)
MEEEIYADVLFIINFSMDFLSLYIVGRLMHFLMSAKRVIFAASLGALYGVLELLLHVSSAGKTGLTLLVLGVMCLVAFGYHGFRTYAASVALTFGVSMLIGGMMTSAFLKLGNDVSYLDVGGSIATVYGDIPIWKFAVYALISALATWGLGKLFRRKRALRTCTVRMRFGGEEKELTALVDSGNLLEDPVSGTPVIFLSGRAARILPQNLLTAMKNGVASLSLPDAGKLRVIPSRTVSGDGVLLAAVPERVCLRSDAGWEPRRALVAVDFSGGDYGGFEALVPEILFY